MSEFVSVTDRMHQVLNLRVAQGWDATYVEGETALIISLVQSGESPESIAEATHHKDWPSRVAEFRGSPVFLETMGVSVKNSKTSRTWWGRLFSRPAR
jgi:hypothetical protein